jgi:hypothetical protein
LKIHDDILGGGGYLLHRFHALVSLSTVKRFIVFQFYIEKNAGVQALLALAGKACTPPLFYLNLMAATLGRGNYKIKPFIFL